MAKPANNKKPGPGRKPVPADAKKERCTFSVSKSVKEMFFEACDRSCSDPNRAIETLMLDYHESKEDSRALQEELDVKKAELARLAGECGRIEARLSGAKEVEKASAGRLKNDMYMSELVAAVIRIKGNRLPGHPMNSIPSVARELAQKYGYLASDVANDINTAVSKQLVMSDSVFRAKIKKAFRGPSR